MARLSARARDSNGERDALLAAHQPFASKDASADKTTKIRTFLNGNIDTRRADVLLIVAFFISGMVDAGAYNAYECFTSMQTGNTVFAALGVSSLPVSVPKLAWVKSVTSILCFFLGSFLLTTMHRYFGERKRWVLSLSFLIQAVFIAIAAVMVNRGHSSGSPVGGKSISSTFELSTDAVPKNPGFPLTDLIPIGLLSFQSAGKVVASRATQQNALPVVVLTTLFSDLIADPALFTGGLTGNIQRNRRLGGMVFYFCGATVGGVAAATSSVGFSGGLGIACGIQLCVTLGWLLWFGEKQDDDEER